MVLVAATTAGPRGADGDDHVGVVTHELLGDLAGGAGIGLGALEIPLQVLAGLEAFGDQFILGAVTHGVQRRVFDEGGDGHHLLGGQGRSADGAQGQRTGDGAQ
jgi:hypothetical protein